MNPKHSKNANLGLVSVVIPAYNAAAFVKNAIDSVLIQTYKNREILVVNDGSTDNTADQLANYGDAITVLSQVNGGLSSARNLGIKQARGEFIAFLDADDYWMPDKLKLQVSCMLANQALGFCSTRTQVVDPSGKPTGTWDCPERNCTTLKTIFSRHASIPGSGSSVMARRHLFDSVGLFDTELECLEDIDMWMRLAATCEYECIDSLQTVIVKSTTSMSSNLDKMRNSAVKVMQKNRDLLPEKDRSRFWQRAYSGMLTDYVKWELREGRRSAAISHILEAFLRSPIEKARLKLGLLFVALTARQAELKDL